MKKEFPFIFKDYEFEEGEELLPVTDKSLPGVKPKYFVSNKGNIYSEESAGKLVKLAQTPNSGSTTANGSYLYVKMQYTDEDNNQKRASLKVHRVVASEFLSDSKTEENNTVDHINYNKEDNRVENLEWVSLQENLKRSKENGLMHRPLQNEKDTLHAIASELEKGYKSIDEIAQRYKVSRSQVARIKNGSYKDIIGDKYKFKFHKDLTDDDLADIFIRSHNGEDFYKLAAEYDVSYSTIRNIYYPNGGIYEQRLADKGCILERANKANDDIVYDIYTRANNGESVESLSEEYGLSLDSVKKMKNGSSYYKDFLARKGVEVDPYEPLSEETVIEIYNKSKNGASDDELAKEYNLYPKTIAYIRIGKRRYGEILEKYKLTPIKLHQRMIPKPNKFTEEEAIEIYNRLKTEKISTNKLAAILGCDKSIIANIKYCRRSYEYLKYKYGLEPLE